MREIKFKVWDTKNNQFHDDEKGYISDSEWIGINGLFRQIQPRFVPLQFTGLKDKNGKEIYEGDLIKSEGEFIGEIKYRGQQFYLSGDNYSNPQTVISQNRKDEQEVIGNIYENPDLLE